ncbi:MAG: PQQ-like beta-propeller repeat protein [Rhodospirillales bacterium]|nr:PQQ-like beta-propeller repeat protein [Rhodospirillales bacterium]MDH3911558.1 PQQ-like beta-propeller repeat protein [Rhodospirillales bacterium]MDH3918074.1 PQQ-like beta-propeller repeat protein [Rhodospirillales bacterium]MDH3967030.1 PQQ-like beta-propeller repeat protein [Rhodospirillales bacterium]
MTLRIACLLLCGAVLAGCSGGWFGGGEDDAPLPGERVAIMTFGRSLEPDPRIADLEVRLPAPRVNKSWSQAGGEPGHAMHHLSLEDKPREAWRAGVGRGSDSSRWILAQPLVVEDRVYAMDSEAQITAFGAEDGDRIWQVDLDLDEESGDYFGGGIAYEAGRIYVTTGFGTVFALNAETGETIWSQPLTAPLRAAPTVSGGRVFAVTLDNQAFALAADDGRRLWNHSGIEEAASLLGAASVAVSGSAVVVPYSSGEIFSLLVENGRVLWSDALSAVNRVDPIADLAHIRGLPVIDRGAVMAISHSGRMVAVDLRRGARAWDIELGGVQMPWVAGEFVYLVTNEAEVVCLTRRDGRIRWVQTLPHYKSPENQTDPIQWFGPVLAGDRLILAGSNAVAVSISPYTGEILGEQDLPGAAAVSPVVAGDTLYFLTNNATLLALR